MKVGRLEESTAVEIQPKRHESITMLALVVMPTN